MKELIIVFAGTQGKIVAEVAELCGFSIAGFLDDSLPKDSYIGPLKIIGTTESFKKNLLDHNKYFFTVAIGDSRERRRTSEALLNNSYSLSNIIHPNSFISKSASLGCGIFINNFSTIFSGASVGDFVLLDNHASIGVDCKVGKSCFIGPGAHINSGCSIGDESYLGSCATLIPGINVGKNVVIGANSTVTKNIPSSCTVVGSPAKPLKNK